MSIPDFCLVLVFGERPLVRLDRVLADLDPTQIIDDDMVAAVSRARADTDNLDSALQRLVDEVELRLRQRLLTVVYAGDLTKAERGALIQTAKRCFAKTIAIVVEVDSTGAHGSGGRTVGRLTGEGLSDVIRISDETGLMRVLGERQALSCDRRSECGPFDIIGDVHGCRDELIELLGQLGYGVTFRGQGSRRKVSVSPSAGRRLVFVGDLVDRGPASPDVLRLVMEMVERNQAFCVLGNHDSRYMRYLQGRDIRLTHGLEATVSQFRAETQQLRDEVRVFFEIMPYQLWLHEGDLVVAHAGVREDMIGRDGGAVREFCLFGDRSGGKDEMGLPVRYHWALEYGGDPAILYGHTPVPEAEWVNNTLCLDTGCVFGGQLTALRWPEREIVSVPARKAYVQRFRPFGHPPPRPTASDDC
ncbi:MAG: metallophosphoesterase [Hyphomicrobiaceae bacterium]